MADRTLSEEDSFRRKQKSLFEERFCAEGEELLWFETPAQGYVASVIAGQPRVPHTAQNEVRGSVVPEPEWPLPSEELVNGWFLGDEWADDPTIMWWVFAAEAGQDAVRIGDHLAQAPDVAFLVMTGRRFAVVVKAKQLADEPQEAGGGLFGRAKAMAAQVQRAAESITSDNSPVAYAEIPAERIARVQAVDAGRSIPRATFVRIDFTDGSTLHIRTARHYAAEHAEHFTP